MELPKYVISVWPKKSGGITDAVVKLTIGGAISIFPLKIVKGSRDPCLSLPKTNSNVEVVKSPVTLEEKYRMPERAIREVKYMDVPELMEKLKKAKPAEKLSEGQENSGNKALWLRKPEPKSNDGV